MKTKLVTIIALIGLHLSEEARLPKAKRGSLLGDYSYTNPSYYSDDLNQSPSGWQVTTGDFNLNVDLPPPPSPHRRPPPRPLQGYPRPIPSYGIISNSIENKPVIEAQDYLPPQAMGTAQLPQMPVPAVPVNALASNIPASRGAVFLGSGSLGVVNLGNGAYALGSGSLGYSENRSRPRPTARVPVYPPIQATPDLLPAAVPTPLPPQQSPPFGLVPGNIDFNHPLFNVPQVPQIDQNGYEYLPPSRVGFGTPNPPRPIRTRQQFATPTALQIPIQVPQFSNIIRPQQQVPNNVQYSIGQPSIGNFPILA